MASSFKAGVGRSIITPPVGTTLYGYAPGRPSESVNDDLRVTCLAFQSGADKALLISADICTYRLETSLALRQRIEEKTGVPADHILFSPTHTHSGPATSAGIGWGKTDTDYNETVLEPNVINAAEAACTGLQDAVMGIGVTQSDVGINRRQLTRDGAIKLGQNPWGPYDPAMTVLSFRTLAGEPIANLIHYGCHGTAAGKSPEITRDWSGPMVDMLEEQSGAITVFFNGPEGDIGPRLPNEQTKGDLPMSLALGARAGFDAVRAWRSIKDMRSVPIRVLAQEIALPWKPLPSLEEARKELAEMGPPDNLVGSRLGMYEKRKIRMEKIIEEHESGRPIQTHFRFLQSIIALGPVAFVPFPYEVFVEITLRIRQFSPFQHTLCLSNTNGSFGYFPTLSQFPLGGYEIKQAAIFNTYVLAEDADTAAVEEHLRLLETLARTP